MTLTSGWAGFVRGPKTLKTVGMPISFRTPAAKRMAGWNAGAKQKVIPTSSKMSGTLSTGTSRLTPNAASTSDDPVVDDAARDPCFTTPTPVPAITIAAIVEMFTVFARSPPVPTMSTLRPLTSMRCAWESIVSTMPLTSRAVAPFVCIPIKKAPSCASVARPSKTSPSIHAVSAESRSSSSERRVRMSGHVAIRSS